jgi:poly(A) polymerase
LAAWLLDRAGGLTGALARGPKDAVEFARSATRHARKSLCLSNDESEQLSDVLALFDVLVQRWGEMRVSEQKRAAARQAFDPALDLLTSADAARSEPIRLRYKALEADGVGIHPPPLLTGDHLVAHGYKPGPAFKRVLDEVYDAQLEGGVQTHEQALELARRLYV